MKNNSLKVIKPGGISLIAHLCRKLKIGATIDEMVQWKPANTKASPGIMIESLITSIICGRKALWKLEELWKDQDVELLYPGLSHEHFNDDAYARALDRLAEIPMNNLISEISLNLLSTNKLNINTIHFDTTSKSLQGEYDVEPHGDFKIAYGHSKDHRPDLKQIKMGVGLQQDGQIVMGQMLAGNKSDKAWNPKAAVEMKEFFSKKDYRNIVFVSDAATVSMDALKLFTKKHIQFISRLPETFSLATQLKEEAWQADNWLEVGELSEKGSTYRVWYEEKELEGKKYSFVVVHSSALEQQKEQTLKRRFAKEKEALEKKAKKLCFQEFACIHDAQVTLEKLVKEVEKKGFEIQAAIVEKTNKKYLTKGRPLEGQQPLIEITYLIQYEIVGVRKDFFLKCCQLESTFVLIASVRNHTIYNPAAILAEYKKQITVESKFRFLKNSVYMGAIYLNLPRRVEALGYVFILALMIVIFSSMEGKKRA